ncbi:MAG: histidine phosphatase family protein [Acidobacteriota bacterium]|nr:histidine phosphatase family protein [Acidobacteriota bacterium]
MKRVILVFLLAALLATSLAAAPNPVTTVILVRHAEKASQEDDSPLTAAGTERAKELARVLAGVKVDAIYMTQFRRVQDTAAPVAAAFGMTPIVRNTGATYAADLAKHIRATHAGQTVLVVGHSNTTINVMKALGASDVASMPESEYDNLFVLTDVEGAAPKVVALRYGVVAR